MSGGDYRRYARQIVLREVGVHGQSLLEDSSVLVVGCGGLGSAAAPYLAGAGIGRIELVDHDRVDISNLHRQLLYRNADTGRRKVDAAADTLRAINADIDVLVHDERADATTLADRVAAVDVVLDCSDNFPTRYAVNAACVAARRPLVSGAAIRFEGQFAVFTPARGGPCYACLYPPVSGADDEDATERCEEAGVLGPVVGVIGAQQALAVLKLLLGTGAETGVLHVWDALHDHWRRLRVPRDSNCPVCGHADETV